MGHGRICPPRGLTITHNSCELWEWRKGQSVERPGARDRTEGDGAQWVFGHVLDAGHTIEKLPELRRAYRRVAVLPERATGFEDVCEGTVGNFERREVWRIERQYGAGHRRFDCRDGGKWSRNR